MDSQSTEDDGEISEAGVSVDDSSSERKRSSQELVETRAALLAGNTAFHFEMCVFRRVLPAGVYRPFIFPRSFSEMEELFRRPSDEGVEKAARKWNTLRTILKWGPGHGQCLELLKEAYMKVAHPLQALEKLHGDFSKRTLEQAFDRVLPAELKRCGRELLGMMDELHMLDAGGLMTSIEVTTGPT